MKKLPIIALLLVGCASYQVKIHVPGCPTVLSPTGCDARSYEIDLPGQPPKWRCIKDEFVGFKRVTVIQDFKYRCAHIQMKENP